MSQVFEVAIGDGDGGSVRVSVVRSSAGEASATVRLDADGLLTRQSAIQQAILASTVRTRRALPAGELAVRDVGRQLFAALLGSGPVGERYRASVAIAEREDNRHRIVIRIDASWAAALPWEAMYDEQRDAYVCRREQVVRHIPVETSPRLPNTDSPLRVLVVVSAPRGLPALDVERERSNLEAALQTPIGKGRVELRWVTHATWAHVQNALLDGTWHAVHFIGHGDFDPVEDQGILTLVGEDGRAANVEAHRFVDLLREAQPMPRLVVLNSCAGGATGTLDPFSGTAATLVRNGVSGVAAMQYAISDPAAIAFSRGFYSAIANGRAVDDALSSGRAAILGLGPSTLEWMTPVMYLGGGDSVSSFRLGDQRQPLTETSSTPAAATPTASPASAVPIHATTTANHPEPPPPGPPPLVASVPEVPRSSDTAVAAAPPQPSTPASRRPSRTRILVGLAAGVAVIAVIVGVVLMTGRKPPAPVPQATPASSSPAVVTSTKEVVLTSPQNGADVPSCQMFTGHSRLPSGKTLVLATRNIDGSNLMTYYQTVQHWDEPQLLTDWSGAQFFGSGNTSVGQHYQVRVLVMDVAAVRRLRDAALAAGDQPWHASSDEQGTVTGASITVHRVVGKSASGCG